MSSAELHQYFNEELKKVSFNPALPGLYEPINYIVSLGGKRIRPVMVLMGCNMFSDNIQHAIAPAIAVELFHNFTLMHDDIMDKAPLRRGKATVHSKYNTNTAILSGDVALVYAYKYLSDIGHDKLPAILNVFNKTAIEVCEGQQLDMEYEVKEEISMPEYIEMIKLKTAVLLGCSLKMGAIMGNGSDEDADHLYEFGKNIGISFQIQDDILDTFGDETFGKKVGGDILQNKKTFLLVKALESANAAQAIQLESWINNHKSDNAEKIACVQEIYTAIGVKESAETEMNRYYETALQHLNQVSCAGGKKSPLLEVAEQLRVRKV